MLNFKEKQPFKLVTRKMNILGIHAHGHDAGAAIVLNGRLFSISLERLTRKKHDGEFPAAAIDYVLQQAGIGMSEIDIAVADALASNTEATRRGLRKAGCRADISIIPHHDAHAAGAYLPVRSATLPCW